MNGAGQQDEEGKSEASKKSRVKKEITCESYDYS